MSTKSNSTEPQGGTAPASGWRDALAAKEEVRLIESCRQGDLDAFDSLIRLYQDQVFGLAWHMLRDRDEAEDVAQEVFLSLYRNLDKFRGESRLSTWLYRVTANRVKNRWKYHQRRKQSKHDSLDEALAEDDPRTMELPDPTPDARRQAAGREMVKILEERMDLLSEEYKEALVLRFVQNLSYEEIAEVLECSIGTVKSRINRARKNLRESMRDVL